jgi:hypothetical protein
MDAMALGGVVRQAVKLLRGIDVKLEEVRGYEWFCCWWGCCSCIS